MAVAIGLGLLTAGVMILVDYLWPLKRPNRQTLHDLLAETVAVVPRPSG